MTITIQIELLVLLFIILLVAVWVIWYRLSTRWIRKKYKPEEDKSKYGEEKRRAELEGREFEPSKAAICLSGLAPVAERELLSNAAVNPIGEDSKPDGTDSNSIAGIVRKLKRKK